SITPTTVIDSSARMELSHLHLLMAVTGPITEAERKLWCEREREFVDHPISAMSCHTASGTYCNDSDLARFSSLDGSRSANRLSAKPVPYLDRYSRVYPSNRLRERSEGRVLLSCQAFWAFKASSSALSELIPVLTS